MQLKFKAFSTSFQSLHVLNYFASHLFWIHLVGKSVLKLAKWGETDEEMNEK